MGRVLCGNIVCPALRAFVAHARSLRSFWNCTTTAPFQQSGKSSNPDSSYRSGWQLHSASGRALHLKLLPWPSTQVHSSLSKLGCQRANQILILKCLILKSTDWSSKSCRQQPKANKEALQSGMEEKATKHNIWSFANLNQLGSENVLLCGCQLARLHQTRPASIWSL